ncbi:hypothetical protein J3A70_004344 [Pseudomonas sp. PvP088]|nr:hypothetical protein [Pseudomonas sp. PvP088]
MGPAPQVGDNASRETKICQMLCRLRRDVEDGPGTEAVKARRRAALRGMQASIWALERRSRVDVLEQDLRAELFGLPPGASLPNDEE